MLDERTPPSPSIDLRAVIGAWIVAAVLVVAAFVGFQVLDEPSKNPPSVQASVG